MESKTRILIVDDDPDFVEGMRSILEKGGYEVEAAYNPDAGFESLKSQSFDLLCLDIMMGRGAEGVMLARKISKDEKLREIPTLIITGIREQIAYLFPGQPVHPHFLPVDELIEKPVEPDVLLEKVSMLLKMAEDRKAQTNSE